MRAVIFLSAVCLTATTAVAQRPAAPKPTAQHAAKSPAPATGLKAADVAGTWSFQSNVKNTAGQDTVVSSELSVSADAKTWTTHLAGRDPVVTRVVAMAGDSVVTESGPFPSVARPGQKVRTQETFHFKGNDAWGTIVARYSNGQIITGTVKGTRKK